MKRRGSLFSMLAATGLMAIFGASIGAHAGAVNPADSQTDSTGSPTVDFTSFNETITSGTIQNIYHAEYFPNENLNNLEEYTAISDQLPSDILSDLLSSSLVTGNAQLLAQLTTLANGATDPTDGEFLTQQLPNELAYATAPANQVGTQTLTMTDPDTGATSTDTIPNLEQTGSFGNTTIQDPTQVTNVTDIAQLGEDTVGQRTALYSSYPNTLGQESFTTAAILSDSSTDGSLGVGSLDLSQDQSDLTIEEGTVTFDIYQLSGTRWISPIVMDVSGTGRLEASKGVWLPHPKSLDKHNVHGFDFFNNGFPIAMEWVGPHDGLLVEPKADGSVDGSCLFGTQGGFFDGYEKLSIRDKNHDGRLTGDELKGLYVWVDANQDAVCQPSELKSLADLGVTEISLKDNHLQSTFVMNGKAHRMWDWCPSGFDSKRVSLQTARTELQADRDAMQQQ